MRPILASSILVGPPAKWEAFLSTKTSPSINSESSIVPPSFVATWILFKSAFVAVSLSMILRIESTAIGASKSEWCDTTFDEREVIAF